MPDPVVIAWETWASAWPEGEALAKAHFSEVEGVLAEKRPCKIDEQAMIDAEKAGVLRVAGARVGGRLVGYCSWSLMPDIESKGLIVANQGAIYVDPRFAGLGYRMLTFSLPGLKMAGADYALMHHRMLGRGARLGVWFRRLKAVLIKHEYYLWLRD
jgi:hypothetical protein